MVAHRGGETLETRGTTPAHTRRSSRLPDTPNRSTISAAQRFSGGNDGAPTDRPRREIIFWRGHVGKAASRQLQRQAWARCSVTIRGDRTARYGRGHCPGRGVPHPAQISGKWSMVVSGVSTRLNVLPGWPFCPPVFLPDRSRRLHVARAGWSRAAACRCCHCSGRVDAPVLRRGPVAPLYRCRQCGILFAVRLTRTQNTGHLAPASCYMQIQISGGNMGSLNRAPTRESSVCQSAPTWAVTKSAFGMASALEHGRFKLTRPS